MNQKNDLSLSLSGDAFSALRSDFDQVLRSPLAGMIDTDQDTAEVSMKVKITLTEDSAPDYSVAGGQHTREITKPKFEHTVTAVIQRKEKKTGTFSGEYELVLDRETGKYVARPIDNGQTTLFDDDGDQCGEVIDADYTVVHELGEGQRGLPEAAEEPDEDEGTDTPEETEDGIPGAVDESDEETVDPAHDPSTPFGWLRQFIGKQMKVMEALGNYTVRTLENKVVLSSAAAPGNPFHCPVENLKGHEGHDIICVGYGKDEIVNISIECENCNEVLFSLDAPGYGADEDGAEDETGDYEYDAPETEEPQED